MGVRPQEGFRVCGQVMSDLRPLDPKGNSAKKSHSALLCSTSAISLCSVHLVITYDSCLATEYSCQCLSSISERMPVG